MRLSALYLPFIRSGEETNKTRARKRCGNECAYPPCFGGGRDLLPRRRAKPKKSEEAVVKTRYPLRMTYTQWRRTPYRQKYWMVGLALCDLLGHWRSCSDNRCRRARRCQNYRCYWKRRNQMSEAERRKADGLAKSLKEMLRIGSTRGSEGLWLY
jgi:hypothetical protein